MSGIRNIFRLLPDKVYLNLVYFKHFKKFIDFKNPKTYNEKLQWLKIYDRNPIYTQMVDKYLVKKYIAERIGSEYLIPTLGVWEKAEDIDFESLPNEFVLKCNNDSGGIIICKNKEELDKNSTVSFLKKRLKSNGYWYGREWPYKNVSPRIIAEKYMKDNSGELIDYKIHCFNGKPRFILVCSSRFSLGGLREDFYDIDWKLMDVHRPNYPQSDYGIERPHNLNLMLELSEKLSAEIPFLRVDFYEVQEKIYFGELTFYPASGFGKFTPKAWNNKFGKWIELPCKSKNRE